MDNLDGNVTQPQWIKGPTRGVDGYEGTSEHFDVRFNIIKIKNTDAVADNAPSEKQRQFTVHEGKFSQHELQVVKDDAYQLWMCKIGPYLADWVLGLPRRGAF